MRLAEADGQLQRARVMATYIRRRFPPARRGRQRVPVREEALLQPGQEDGIKPSPLAEWDGHQLHGVPCPAAWLSPASRAACVRKAASGDMISPVLASGVAPGVPCFSHLSTGKATASCQKPLRHKGLRLR